MSGCPSTHARFAELLVAPPLSNTVPSFSTSPPKKVAVEDGLIAVRHNFKYTGKVLLVKTPSA